MKVIQPLNFVKYIKSEAIDLLEKDLTGNNIPQALRESRFTKFYEGFWLLNKFGYDKKSTLF